MRLLQPLDTQQHRRARQLRRLANYESVIVAMARFAGTGQQQISVVQAASTRPSKVPPDSAIDLRDFGPFILEIRLLSVLSEVASFSSNPRRYAHPSHRS